MIVGDVRIVLQSDENRCLQGLWFIDYDGGGDCAIEVQNCK